MAEIDQQYLQSEAMDRLLIGVNKPTRYIGGEWNSIVKDLEEVELTVALAFPDLYEVGMSHLGLKILYHLINSRQELVAERVYAPAADMEREMRERGIPLFSLESRRPVGDFDLLGFTLQYELSYSNLLNMLKLAGIPLYASERGMEQPLIIAGGPNAFNPEPLADFIDLFVIGEAEELLEEFFDCYLSWKRAGEREKKGLLEELSSIKGLYIPTHYDVKYSQDGVPLPQPAGHGKKDGIKKRVVAHLDQAFYPEKMILPYMEIIHDRVILEIARGCTRGCRFCQAGVLYRPVRERSPDRLQELAALLLSSTGYDELSLASLSTSDYSRIGELTNSLVDTLTPKGVSISLPSLRLDSFSISLAERVQQVRKSGLTFAPEAGTEALREVINKNINEEDLLSAVKSAFQQGWKRLKLYFMIGLPTESREDLDGILELTKKVRQAGRKAGTSPSIAVSVSNFIPKPHTALQWVPFTAPERLQEKVDYLKGGFRKQKRVNFNWHDIRMSLLEAAFSRGDRRLAPVLERAVEKGCRFDGWSEHFDFKSWQQAFSDCGLSMEDFACRQPSLEEELPWDHIDSGVSKSFLRREYRRAQNREPTPDCREKECTGCGLTRLLGSSSALCGVDQQWD